MEDRVEYLERRVARLEERLDEMQRLLPNAKFPSDAVGGTVLLAPLMVVTAEQRILLNLKADEHGTQLNLFDGSLELIDTGQGKERGQAPAIHISASPAGQRDIIVFDKAGKPLFHEP